MKELKTSNKEYLDKNLNKILKDMENEIKEIFNLLENEYIIKYTEEKENEKYINLKYITYLIADNFYLFSEIENFLKNK